MFATLTLAQYILLAPLVTFTLLAFFHHRLPRHGDWLGITVMFSCFGAAMLIFFKSLFGEHPVFVHWTFDWLPVGRGRYALGGVLIDGLTSVMLVVVTLVSSLVHLFSSKYMEGDVRYGRYYASLMLFTTSMLGLILSDNVMHLFVFWELVGLSSYTLIGHWYEKKSASNAAIKAFITTRVGDVGMLLGILILYWKVGSFQYVDLFAAVGGALNDDGGTKWLTLAGLGLFFGAMGKSAQFPLHVWLPDAMEGPTPVSALIHAATMVAAGVYLVGRLFPLFTPDAFIFIAYVGAITAIFAASIAFVQDDIKKVLAYSTLSQLGYMMLGLGVGGFVTAGYYAGLFHLTTHAFFKAGMFLGSGSVIHAMHHEQRLSRYGGLRKKLPVTHLTYLLCVLAIAGFPFLTSGFFSKDAILGSTLAYVMDHPKHWFLVLSGFATAAMTAFYMFRQYFLTFHGEPRDHHAYDHAHESPAPMLIPLVVLAFLAVVSGWGSWFYDMAPPPDRAGLLRLYGDYHSAQKTEAPLLPATYEAFNQLRAEDHAHSAQGDEGHGADATHAADAHGAAGEHHHDVKHVHGFAHYGTMMLATLLAFAGFALAWAGYIKKAFEPALVARRLRPLTTLLENKYYFDDLYGLMVMFFTRFLIYLMHSIDTYIIDKIVVGFGYAGRYLAVVVGVFDNFVVDGAVVGSAKAAGFGGRQISYLQTGRVRNYLGYVAAGVIGLSVILLLVI